MICDWTSVATWPDLVLAPGGVQEEHGAGGGVLQHVHLLEEALGVAGHEGSMLDQVGRADRVGPEAQVRNGETTGLLGVVEEVALGVVVGLFADDLDRVLVGAHGAVGTHAVEQATDRFWIFRVEGRIVGSERWVTSSLMPTVNSFLGEAEAKLSKIALVMAGVNSLELKP
jgi:hypothetical protein